MVTKWNNKHSVLRDKKGVQIKPVEKRKIRLDWIFETKQNKLMG